MKNFKLIFGRIVMVLLLIIVIFSITITNIKASGELNNDPYDTYTVGLKGEKIVSPLAYEGVSVLGLGLEDAKDIYIDKDDVVWISDRALKKVVRYDVSSGTTSYLGEGVLMGPTGVCLDNEGNVYVADFDGKAVFKMKQDGTIIKKFERPSEALFGEQSQFRPTKVVVDNEGNLYITSDGNSNGIIQINKYGEFMGYFGPNNVNLTIELFLKRLMLSKEDRETYASLTPKATTNLAIDNKNIVYTVIEGETGVSLKKYNISGTNVLPKDSFFSSTYQDITVDKNGFIYAVDTSQSGCVQVMNQDGSLLFMFGSQKTGSLLMGQFDKPTGIAVDSNENIWVLDGGGRNVQIFKKTEFSQIVMEAILAYNNGEYDKATELYNDIIRQNASFVNAYVGLGRINQRLENYDEALEYFKISNYKSGYSEVYWELRDNWLEHNLVWIIILIVVLIIMKIFKLWSRLFNLLKIDFSKFKEKCKNSRLFNELKYLLKIFKDPKDVFYDIKYGVKIRYRTAWGLFLVFILINIFGDYFIRGYLFRSSNASDMNFAFELLKWGLIILIIAVGNYLISTLQNGEGFFRDIFIGAIVSFAPIILFKIPVDLISNVLTYNEGYLYNILNGVLWAWSIFNIILMIKEIHNYTLKELIINILLTFIAVVIMVLLFLVVYVLANQLVQFIVGLVREGVYRT